MPHRGRLNVLTQVMASRTARCFMNQGRLQPIRTRVEGSGERQIPSRVFVRPSSNNNKIHLSLPEPSHLEIVDPRARKCAPSRTSTATRRHAYFRAADADAGDAALRWPGRWWRNASACPT